METYYFTFGQSHTHRTDGVTLDRDAIIEINAKDSGAARKIMFDTFGNKWSMQYSKRPETKYFPRGVVLTLGGDTGGK